MDELPVAAGAPTPGAARTRGGGTSPTSNTPPVVALAQADIARTLSAVIGPVHEALAKVAPEEVTIELALGLKGEVGVFVARSEGNASLKVTAKWKFPPAKPAVQG